jgi:carbonic anhydrase/acetyltransferase-like protein (isoleucine patch superfamily)
MGKEVKIMIIKHLDKIPEINDSTFIAPNAAICGDVKIGKNCRIMFGAAIIAEGGRIEMGDNCIVFENAVIRSTPKHSTKIGNSSLIGPNAHVVGCIIEDCVFVATGASIFHGAHLGRGAEVRINGVVHLLSVLPPGTTVPIGWIAVGNPAQIFSPNEHEKIWALQKELNFPETVYGVDRKPDNETNMPQVTQMLAKYMGTHKNDEIIES